MQIDTTCDYLWLRARGSGVVWLQTTPFGSVPSNTVANVLFNGLTVPDWTWTRIGSRSDENLQRIPEGSTAPANDTAQRDFNFTPGTNLYVLAEPTVHLDSWFCSTNANANPVSPGGGPGVTVNYTLYEAATEPTVDAVAWDNASIVNKTGAVSATPPDADMIIKAVWINGTPDRMCVRAEETLANLTWIDVAEDSTSIASYTSVVINFKIANLNRVRDELAWLIGASPQPDKYDANWPGGVFSTTVDLTNVSLAQSVSGNRRRIQMCFDTPDPIATGSQWLCDFVQYERITGGTLRSKRAFGAASGIDQWGICAAGGALPGASDGTAPSVGTASVNNVTANSFTVTATASDAESGISGCQIVYKTPASGTPTFGTDPSVTGTMTGGSCSANVLGLTASTAYRVAVRAVNGVGLVTQGTTADQTTSASAGTFYVSTTGSGSTCSNGAPCALSRLMSTTEPRPSPGETWIVKNGTYNQTPSNKLDINCATSGGNALNGTASQPIILKAETSRQAWLKGNGDGSTFRMINCSYWVIDGLRFSAADNTNNVLSNGTVNVTYGNFIVVKNILIHHTNRCGNNSGFSFSNTTNSILEDSALYYHHRNGITNYQSSNNIIRRNYTNSRGYMDACGYVSGMPGSGDESFNAYPSSNILFENNITENNGQGFMVNASNTSVGNKFIGNIDLNTSINGQTATARGNSLQTMPRDTVIENHVSINAGQHAMRSLSAKNTQYNNVSVFDAGMSGIIATTVGSIGDGQYSVFVDKSTVISANEDGIEINSAIQTWGIDTTASFGNNPNYNSVADNATFNTNRITANPNLGNCRVYVPSGSPLFAPGVGANILYAYANGILTGTKLWDTGNGGKWLGAGANIAGTNPPFSGTILVTNADIDTTTNSAQDVHSRLNIMSSGCLPGGY
jgi:hypothetical protein